MWPLERDAVVEFGIGDVVERGLLGVSDTDPISDLVAEHGAPPIAIGCAVHVVINRLVAQEPVVAASTAQVRGHRF